MSHQVTLRDMIEKETKSVTYVAQKRLIEKVEEARKDHHLSAGVVGCFALETNELLNNSRYDQLLNGDFRETLLNLSIDVATNLAHSTDTRIQAIWVACECNYKIFLDVAAQFVSSNPSDQMVSSILTATVTYSHKSSASHCCEGLEKVWIKLQQSQTGKSISEPIMKALREAIGYFRFKPGSLETAEDTYTESYRVLTHVLKQPGRSHPDIRKAFDACLRTVNPEDLKTILPNNYLGALGLFTILSEKVLPALSKVLSVYNDEMLVDLGYLYGEGSETLVSDLRELDELFRSCYLKIKNAQLSENSWRQTRERIRNLGERIRINFLSQDKSILHKMLQKSLGSVEKAVQSVTNKFRISAAERELKFKIDLRLADGIVIVPFDIVGDALETLIDNAVRYSECHSNILVQAYNDQRGTNINIQSSPRNGFGPEIRPGHGLERATLILKKYDSELLIDPEPYAADMIASVTISLPTARRVLGYDY